MSFLNAEMDVDYSENTTQLPPFNSTTLTNMNSPVVSSRPSLYMDNDTSEPRFSYIPNNTRLTFAPMDEIEDESDDDFHDFEHNVLGFISPEPLDGGNMNEINRRTLRQSTMRRLSRMPNEVDSKMGLSSTQRSQAERRMTKRIQERKQALQTSSNQ